MNIKSKTCRDFDLCLDYLQSKYGEDFEYLNGFHESQMDHTDFINGFIDKNVADATIDSNANASTKDIRSLLSEQSKSEDKMYSFNKIFFEIKKKYGLKTARRWLEEEWNGGYYMHNSSTSSFLPYCFAYDLSRLAKEGLFFLKNYNNQAPGHLTTFIDDLIEYISFMSNRSSGAVGIANVLIWTYYFWKKDCKEGYILRNPEYYAKQSFQKLIYRINQPFLRVDQSAFVNVSIFDRNYIEALFGGMEFPDGTFAIDEIEGIIEHQKWFMEVVSETRSVNMLTFPVLTYSLLKRDDITEEEAAEMIRTKNFDVFVDKEFARWCSDHNVTWNDSNFFMSDNVGTLSNCCFTGDTLIKIYDIEDEFDPYVTSFKSAWQLYGSDTDIGIFNRGNFYRGKIIRLPGRPLYEIKVDGKYIKCTDNHLWPVVIKGKNDSETLTTKSTCNIHEGEFLSKWNFETESEELVEIEYCRPIDQVEKFVYCFQMADDDYPWFTLANGIVTHNCRLLSDTRKLDAFINSVGGTALSIGSCQVNTINLMRIYYESAGDAEKFMDILWDKTLLCCQVLDRVRWIIKRNIEKGLLPNYCEGGVEMDKQYCTIGILSLFECVEAFGYIIKDEFGNYYYSDDGIKFASKIFEVLNNVKDQFFELDKDLEKIDKYDFDKEYSFNIESVPKVCGHMVA